MAEKELPNLRVLVPIRVGGTHRAEVSVIAKSEFTTKGDWHDLTVMEPARLEETDAKVGPAPTPKGEKPLVPGT